MVNNEAEDQDLLLAFMGKAARLSFRHFIEYIQPEYQFNWHHLALIDALQRLADRKYQRLIVMMPPRHGKSELVSRLFPAWCFVRNQNEQVIVSSYSLDLASAMNRDCQRIITSQKYLDLFPDVRLSEGRDSSAIKTSKRFDIIGSKGYYIAAGVGGGITGAGATVGIIDDPIKNAEEADSKTYRDKAHEWYKTTFRTRFEPGAIEVICQTRWHEDDLTGRILQSTTPGTEVISFTALAEKNEENRGIGDALWESKYNRVKLLEIQKDVGTRAWSALYQQRPSAEEGWLIKKAWFPKYDPRKFQIEGKIVNFFFDTAYTEDEKNDPTGAIAYVKDGANFYVLEYKSEYLEFPAQIENVKDFSARNGYTSRSIIRVEPKASGKSVVQVLKAATALNIKEARVPKESKTARVNSCAAALESGRVFLPDGMTWVDNFLTECATFPNAAHDEAVDCLTGMMLNEGIGKIQIHY